MEGRKEGREPWREERKGGTDKERKKEIRKVRRNAEKREMRR